MPKVYRMEDRRHRGPFNATFDSDTELAMWRHVGWIEVEPFGGLAALDPDHPHHLKDVLKMEDEGETFYDSDVFGIHPLDGTWLVGCKDLDQFYHWFPAHALPDFAHCGMHLHVYECAEEAIKYGKWQLMFDPKRAKLVKSEPLTKPLAA